MNLYPWLISDYKKIIFPHKIKKGHYSIIIETQKGIGVTNLIKNISTWLLCKFKIDIYACNKCHSCKLMNIKNHPDFHNIKNLITRTDTSKKIGIEIIRNISEVIFKSAQQGHKKIIYFSNIIQLTEFAINSLLKIVEEPPENTYFLFVNYIPYNIVSTLRSRCISYRLSVPVDNVSIQWLKKDNPLVNKKEYITALRINDRSPILAKKFINSKLWIMRIEFFNILKMSLKEKNLLNMLTIFNQKEYLEKKIFWICSVLLDTIKYKNNINITIINIDQITLIKYLALKFNVVSLDNSYRSWIYCYNKILNVLGVNIELLLIKQLLQWEEFLKISFL